MVDQNFSHFSTDRTGCAMAAGLQQEAVRICSHHGGTAGNHGGTHGVAQLDHEFRSCQEQIPRIFLRAGLQGRRCTSTSEGSDLRGGGLGSGGRVEGAG